MPAETSRWRAEKVSRGGMGGGGQHAHSGTDCSTSQDKTTSLSTIARPAPQKTKKPKVKPRKISVGLREAASVSGRSNFLISPVRVKKKDRGACKAAPALRCLAYVFRATATT